MGDVMKKVKTGDPLAIPARTFNAFIDAARDHQDRQRGRDRGALRRLRQNGIVPVKNASGADRDRFDVLGIDAPLFTPTENEESFKNEPAVSGVVPVEADQTGRFVVLLEPVKAGEIALGCALGVCPVHVDMQDEAHRFADVAEGVTGHLVSGPAGGAEILWAEAGTGVKWALVKVGAGTDERVKVSHDDTTTGYLRKDDDDDLQAHHKVAGSVEELIDSLPDRKYADDVSGQEGWIQIEPLADGDDEQLVLMHTLPGDEQYYFKFGGAGGEGQMWEQSLDALGHVRYTRGCGGCRRGPRVD